VKSAFLGFGIEEALRHLADALADGLFTTDAEGRITYWNDAAQRITGWTAEEAVSASCSLLAGDAANGATVTDDLALRRRRRRQGRPARARA
jgi:PAS domain S-box-containing protein